MVSEISSSILSIFLKKKISAATTPFQRRDAKHDHSLPAKSETPLLTTKHLQPPIMAANNN